MKSKGSKKYGSKGVVNVGKSGTEEVTVKPIKCPYCGSKDIKTLVDGRVVCMTCGQVHKKG